MVHHFDRLSNFRDIGGLPTVDGRTSATGLLFRSEELCHITGQDLTRLRQLDIRLICDLRAPGESRARPRVAIDGAIRVVNIPIHEQATQDGGRRRAVTFLFGDAGAARFWEFSRGYYQQMAFAQAPRIGQVITLLAADGNLPALIHCRAGKDRTGLLAALIQLLTGVPYEAVLEDYLRTNRCFSTRLEKYVRMGRILTLFQVPAARIRLVLMAHPELLNEVHGDIVKRYGSVETYLAEACGVDRAALRKLKTRLLGADQKL